MQNKELTLAVLEQFFKIVISALENGEDVFIRGFGTFMVKKRNQTLGRNIHKNTPSSYPNIVYQYLTLPGSLTIK